MKTHVCPSREYRLSHSSLLLRCYVALGSLVIVVVALAPVAGWQRFALIVLCGMSLLSMRLHWRAVHNVVALCFEGDRLGLLMRDGRRLEVEPVGNGVVCAWWLVFSCGFHAPSATFRWWRSLVHFVILPDALGSVDDYRDLRVSVKAWMRAQGRSAHRQRKVRS